MVDLPLRPGSVRAGDLEFDPLGTSRVSGNAGDAADDAGDPAAGSAQLGDSGTPGGPGRQAYHDRPRRRRGLVVLIPLLLAGVMVWLLFPDPPKVDFSVGRVEFGTVRVGESTAETVISVTNVGERKLVIKALTFVNPVEADYRLIEDGCLGRKLESQAGCEVRLAFQPQSPGDRSSFLRFESNDRTGPGLALEATAVAPQLGLAPSAVSFGVVALEAGPESREVTLSNLGSATLELRRIHIDGSAAQDFSRSRRCPSSTLEPGEACSFEVRFEPSVSGPRRATLVIDSDALGGPGRLEVEGVGLWEGPPLDPDAAEMIFAEQRVGRRGAPKSVVFSNRTGGPVSVDRTRVSGSTSFAVVEDGCRERVVASGESCSVVMTFLPVREGSARGVLTLSAAGASEDVAVDLRGRGVTPRLQALVRAVDFKEQRLGFESAPRRVQVRNTGSATLLLRSVSIIGPNGAEFLLGTHECVRSPLPPGQACSIAIGFNPTGSGTRRAVLSVDPGFELEPILVGLEGSGVVSALRADPGRLDFRQTYLGGLEARNLTLTNEGSARLEIRGLRFEGSDAAAFDLGRMSCPLDSGIASGSSCKVGISFEPVTARRYRAQLVIEYNGPDSPARVELAGEGRTPAPAFRISTDSLDLGSAPVGGRSEIGTVVLSNPGAAWLPLTSISLRGVHAEDFQLVAGTCDGTSALAPNGSCTVGIRLAPIEEGSLRAMILVRHGADSGSATVTLTGRGLTRQE